MFEMSTADPAVSQEFELKLRPGVGEADAEAILHIYNSANAADGVPERETLGDMQAWLRNPSAAFDPVRDVTIAEVDGQPVAYADREWVDTNDGLYREYRMGCRVLPEWRGRGIGTRLQAENEARARELAAQQPTDRQEVFGSWTSERQTAATALLTEQGFKPVRWFFDMYRRLAEPIPEVALPEGIEIRQLTPEQYLQFWRADAEAFRDHWGGFDDSEESFKRWQESPSFDPSLWVVAFDGDEVAAGVINAIHPEENEAIGISRGWLHSVFTRRPWRKRGLARALIVRSLQLLRERGVEFGALGVDADNPSGALGLYEGVGFYVVERYTAFRKPFES